MDSKYSIREASQKDADDILRLIKELAEFENMAHAVKIETEALAKDLSSSWYNCLVVDYRAEGDSKEVVGYAIWNYSFHPWHGRTSYMEDVYVSPEHRGHGCGLSMIQSIAKICHKKGCTRLRWAVLGWNKLAKNLYAKINADNLTEEHNVEMWHIEGEELTRLVQGRSSIPMT